MNDLRALSSFRRVLLAAILTVALGVGTATPATATSRATDPSTGTASISPAPSYSSIDNCSLSFSPSTFSATDTFTVTTTFGSAPAWYRIGADGLGPEVASVLVNASSASSTVSVPVATVRENWGLAPGTHSMDFYAVDGTGAAVGAALCTATYSLVGEALLVEFDRDSFADSPLRVGEQVDSDGVFTYTPSATARVTRCDVVGARHTAASETGGDGGRGGAGGRGGDGGVGEDVGEAHPVTGTDIQLEPGTTPDGMNKTILVGTGLEFIPSTGTDLESSRQCGRISGTPTLPGTYTVTSSYHFVPCPSTTAPGSISTAVTAPVDLQTYAALRTFTIVVEATPVFTG